jgi:hypothetical protein
MKKMTESNERNARVWDLFNKDIGRVAESVSNARLNVCTSCEFFFKPTQNCLKCGCIMPLKTKLPNAECPVGKWGRAPRVDPDSSLG